MEEFLRQGLNPDRPGEFNMTAFALRNSAYRNAVSKKHGEVSRSMWQPLWPHLPVDEVPIDYVTNGIHVPTWIDRRLGYDIFSRCRDWTWLEDHDESLICELVCEILDEIIWNHHNAMKNMLITKIKE